MESDGASGCWHSPCAWGDIRDPSVVAEERRFRRRVRLRLGRDTARHYWAAV